MIQNHIRHIFVILMLNCIAVFSYAQLPNFDEAIPYKFPDMDMDTTYTLPCKARQINKYYFPIYKKCCADEWTNVTTYYQAKKDAPLIKLHDDTINADNFVFFNTYKGDYWFVFKVGGCVHIGHLIFSCQWSRSRVVLSDCGS